MTYFAWNTKTARYNLYVPRFQFVLAAEWLRSKDIRFTSRIDYRSDTAIFTIKRNDIAERWINALKAKHGKKPSTTRETTRTITRAEWQRRWQFVPNLNKPVIRESYRDNSPRTCGFSSLSDIAASLKAKFPALQGETPNKRSLSFVEVQMKGALHSIGISKA